MDETFDVKALRERLGWTQERMAQHLGLDRSSVSRMEGGQAPKGPTLILLSQLAQDAASMPRGNDPSSPASPAETTGGES